MKKLQQSILFKMNIIKSFIAVILIITSACQNAASQQENLLKADAFQKKLVETKNAQLVDVRTPEEFQRGHLTNALNMNINSDDLKNRSQYLDKEKPLFVYCYVGGRSAKACDYFRKAGFKIVKKAAGNFVENVFPFSLITKKIFFLQKIDCKIADVLPISFSSAFYTAWEFKKD